MSIPLFTRLGLGLGIGIGATALLSPSSPLRTPAMQCQYSAPYYRPEGVASAESGWAVSPNDPTLSKQGRSGLRGGTTAGSGLLTPRTMKQVSLGSVLGLVAGVGLRAFSRVLALVLGIGVVLVEWAASKGYNILPLDRVQRYVKNVDVGRALSEHRPFKISFGTMMALAAFGQF